MTLSVEEAISEIAAKTPLSESDMRGFLACSDEERRALIEAYANAGIMPTASTWDVVLEVLGRCAEVAGLVLPVVGAVRAIYDLRVE